MWLFALAACTPLSSIDPPGLVGIRVEPSEALVETGPEGAAPVDFEAFGTYEDGREEPLSVVEWGVSNRTAGGIDEAGLFAASNENGGVTWVTAALDGVVGTATVTVLFEQAILVGDADPTLFDAPPVSELSGSWLYPENGVNLPRNTPSIVFQWADLGASAYRLRFSSDVTDLTVFTTTPEWTADAALWPGITSTNAGGTVQVELAASFGGEVRVEPPLAVEVNRLDATGSIIYWCTSVAGFREIPYGGDARDFYTQAQAGRCVGCHVLGPEGTMAFTYDGGNQYLGLKPIDDLGADIVPWGQARANFKAFSPDGALLVGTYGGKLDVYDARTGVWLHDVVVPGGATHPDFSPDGSKLVVTWTDGHDADWSWSGPGRIALLEHSGGGSFGAPQVIFEPPSGYKAYYPTFSPDGRWIAFNVSTGDAYDDPDAELWVVGVDGQHATRLDRANRGPGLTNSWPRWGPLPDDDVLWLTFASKRAYGRVVDGLPQIWVAAFDPARALADEDPSWPAFWLPGQDPGQANHIPQWVP